jgi:antitoxin component YwqK of YwqJK toxin-antitoxin module
MKKLLLLLLLSVGFVGLANADICDESSKVQDRNGVLFLPNQTEPFSGDNLCSFDNGQFKSKGRYIGGLKSGLWTKWHKNGIKISEEAYTFGELESKTFFSDIHYQKIGEIYYINGKESSKTTWSYYPNLQMKFEQNTKNGVAHGIQTDWYENGQKMLEGNFINGKAEGTVTKWYENGNKDEEENFIDGELNGKTTMWYVTGQKYFERNYKDDKLNGKWTTWYKNGQLWEEGNFKDGKENGLQTTWYENGQKRNERFSSEEEVVVGTTYKWYDNGQMRASFSCKDGLPDGVASGWEKSGKEFHAGSFVDGNGFLITLHENSNNKRTEVHFKDGIQVSITYWYENGNKSWESIYVDGEPKTTYWKEDGEFDYEIDGILRTLCINFY